MPDSSLSVCPFLRFAIEHVHVTQVNTLTYQKVVFRLLVKKLYLGIKVISKEHIKVGLKAHPNVYEFVKEIQKEQTATEVFSLHSWKLEHAFLEEP